LRQFCRFRASLTWHGDEIFIKPIERHYQESARAFVTDFVLQARFVFYDLHFNPEGKKF
jgi:hypothetical protein